ncbi:MAG: hypothetical protein JKY56_06310 [Kofleriaceae bacterium]|nr:hypothetical protein [Kofleriaceae bacterium]
MTTKVPVRSVFTPASWGQRMAERGRTAGELAGLLIRNGRWWLLPMLIIMSLTAVLLGVVHVIEYAAPFVYTVF